MGRKRLNVDPNEPLPTRLYIDGRQYRARHPGHPWVYFGREYGKAVAAFKA